ncbi:MAG: hypothetical protein AB7O96_11765 [Pseudobdellovibrionaceae bacterium]
MSRPTPNEPVRTSPILNKEELENVVKLTQKVELEYCLAKRDYADGGDCHYNLSNPEKPRALDLEYKFLGDKHQILCKQVREFSGK